MAEERKRIRFIVNDYQTYEKTAVPLDGETWYFRGVIVGSTGTNYVIGDGSTALENLTFEKPITIMSSSNINLTTSAYPLGSYQIVNNSAGDIEVQWDSQTKNNCLVLPNNTGMFVKTSGGIYSTNMKGPSKQPIMWESDTIPSYAALLDGSATTAGTIGADLYGANYTDWRGMGPVGKGVQSVDIGADSVIYGDPALDTSDFYADSFQNWQIGASKSSIEYYGVIQQTGKNTGEGAISPNAAIPRMLSTAQGAGDALVAKNNGADGQPRTRPYTCGPGRVVNYIAQVRYAVY